jgi:hypothetical protein
MGALEKIAEEHSGSNFSYEKPFYRISCMMVETCSSFEGQLITAISTCFDSITDMNSDCEPTKTIATPSAFRIPLKNTPLALFESETNNLSIRHH